MSTDLARLPARALIDQVRSCAEAQGWYEDHPQLAATLAAESAVLMSLSVDAAGQSLETQACVANWAALWWRDSERRRCLQRGPYGLLTAVALQAGASEPFELAVELICELVQEDDWSCLCVMDHDHIWLSEAWLLARSAAMEIGVRGLSPQFDQFTDLRRLQDPVQGPAAWWRSWAAWAAGGTGHCQQAWLWHAACACMLPVIGLPLAAPKLAPLRECLVRRSAPQLFQMYPWESGQAPDIAQLGFAGPGQDYTAANVWQISQLRRWRKEGGTTVAASLHRVCGQVPSGLRTSTTLWRNFLTYHLQRRLGLAATVADGAMLCVPMPGGVESILVLSDGQRQWMQASAVPALLTAAGLLPASARLQRRSSPINFDWDCLWRYGWQGILAELFPNRQRLAGLPALPVIGARSGLWLELSVDWLGDVVVPVRQVESMPADDDGSAQVATWAELGFAWRPAYVDQQD